MKHFLSIESQTAEQLMALLESSVQFKANRGKVSEPPWRANLGLAFQQTVDPDSSQF